ncbi:hypothetical protein C7999DRAFT_37589 [Corynascus novoguineensis]|uniref:Uncharacterized protein n=1 Tax=Corynascus novoguineensis TaxID=1126955 RepID=A0AAN7HUR0_9PEZI|nr:hypothetical protein C7999DRAFT_37589 [Corynascus novoguineensis]
MSSTPISPAVPGMDPRFAPSSQPPKFWSPPPGPEKPACPYQVDFAVKIKRHTPPPPFGDPYRDPGAWRERSDLHLHSATQTEAVLAYLPLERENILSASSCPPTTLTILKALAMANGRGAQLVVCSIFDPIYYPFEAPEVTHVPDNVAWRAGCARPITLACVPQKYFGSWTFTLPISHMRRKQQWSIRLVLMDNIWGRSIQSVCCDPAALSCYSEPDRLDILAVVLDSVVRHRHAGVDQRDLASRDAILRPHSSALAGNKQPLPQPVIIDYITAVCIRPFRDGKRPFQLKELPENNMQFFWNTSFADFQGWTLSKWDASANLRQQWFKERLGGNAASQYAPVTAKLEFADYQRLSTTCTS